MPQHRPSTGNPTTDNASTDNPSTDDPSTPAGVRCDRCTRAVDHSDTATTVRGSTICSTCLDRFYRRCPSCDGWNRDGDPCGNDCDTDNDTYNSDSCDGDDSYSGGCTCDDCRDDGGWSYPVREYSYKPRPVFHGAGPLFLGAEIEIQTPAYRDADCAGLALSHLGSLGYLKEDSSIDCGFEIVTHPMGYAWAIEHFPWRMLTELAGMGCAATTTTGLHVHLSRAGFVSPCHAYRWMKFIYRNENEVTALARRSSDKWAAFTESDRWAVKDYAKGFRCVDRYRAINTSNQDTFELRIFASSLNPGEVQAALAFAAASVEYTRALTAHDITRRDGWHWEAFRAWLQDRTIYQPLRDQVDALAAAAAHATRGSLEEPACAY